MKKDKQEKQLQNPYGSVDFLDEEEAKAALADSDDELDPHISKQSAILELSDEEGEESNKKGKGKKPDGWVPFPPL